MYCRNLQSKPENRENKYLREIILERNLLREDERHAGLVGRETGSEQRKQRMRTGERGVRTERRERVLEACARERRRRRCEHTLPDALPQRRAAQLLQATRTHQAGPESICKKDRRYSTGAVK